jgi:amino acid transporter
MTLIWAALILALITVAAGGTIAVRMLRRPGAGEAEPTAAYLWASQTVERRGGRRVRRSSG